MTEHEHVYGIWEGSAADGWTRRCICPPSSDPANRCPSKETPPGPYPGKEASR
jgi:hypothetical protein